MFCTNCGMQLDDNVIVCPNCGTQLGEAPQVQPQPMQQVQPQQQMTEQPVQPQPMQQAEQAQPQQQVQPQPMQQAPQQAQPMQQPQQMGNGQPMPVPTPMANNMQQQNYGGQQQNFNAQQQNYSAQQGPINIDPMRNVRFSPDEQGILTKGCKNVSICYLIFAIICSVFAVFFLIMSIACIAEIDYVGVADLIYSIACLLDFGAVAVIFFIKFAEYKKLEKSVVGDTSMIINKFKNYNVAPGIILSVLFFMLGLVPVLITENSINKPIKRMLSSL
ncbi:MAG: zinc ribbon domain-containing protein [Lachnospiraceae bacterium]|nr:zinc ribbon domain-containing protein [Lachnospiraceae bacterium]